MPTQPETTGLRSKQRRAWLEPEREKGTGESTPQLRTLVEDLGSIPSIPIAAHNQL